MCHVKTDDYKKDVLCLCIDPFQLAKEPCRNRIIHVVRSIKNHKVDSACFVTMHWMLRCHC